MAQKTCCAGRKFGAGAAWGRRQFSFVDGPGGSQELDLAADISHVTNIAEILDLGVISTPAVVLDGEVVISGRVPSVPELKKILGNTEALS